MMIVVFIFLIVIIGASIILRLRTTPEEEKPLCVGYEKECLCRICLKKRREWVQQESVHLAKVLEKHLEKIKQTPDIPPLLETIDPVKTEEKPSQYYTQFDSKNYWCIVCGCSAHHLTIIYCMTQGVKREMVLSSFCNKHAQGFIEYKPNMPITSNHFVGITSKGRYTHWYECMCEEQKSHTDKEIEIEKRRRAEKERNNK